MSFTSSIASASNFPTRAPRVRLALLPDMV
jgi:hypothetical protein